MQIEQAVFTSAKTDRAQGYQLLSRSAHLSETEARELSVWAPSHGSLLSDSESATSSNYFTLASGARCISRTSQAGAEYSGRGKVIYTQFLIVPPELMLKFANNPFAILRAAAASGALCVQADVPDTLPPLQLGGRAPVVDLGLVAQLARDPGPAAIATLVQAALDNPQLAVRCETPCEQLVAGLFNLLPVECRPEFSFCTGLKYSPLRQVRISALSEDDGERRAAMRHGATAVQLNATAGDQNWGAYASWIAEVLSAGKLSVLAAELEQSRPGLVCADLEGLAVQLREAMRAGSTTTPGVEVPRGRPASAPVATDLRQRTDPSHAAQPTNVALQESMRAPELDALAEKLAQQPAQILEMLERVDDLVFAAIAGDTRALAELEVLWPLTASELEPELVEQSREQYLRCALAICSESAEGEMRQPERAQAAVDVLCVLFEE